MGLLWSIQTRLDYSSGEFCRFYIGTPRILYCSSQSVFKKIGRLLYGSQFKVTQGHRLIAFEAFKCEGKRTRNKLTRKKARAIMSGSKFWTLAI